LLDPSVWVGREYDLLTAHYFHEDDAYFKTNAFFTTVSGVLLGLASAQGSTRGHWPAVIVLAVFGLTLCLVWFVALVRIRAWRVSIEERIEVLEEAIAAQWHADAVFAPSIRRGAERRVALSVAFTPRMRALTRIPASRIILGVPLVVAVLWMALAIYSAAVV